MHQADRVKLALELIQSANVQGSLRRRAEEILAAALKPATTTAGSEQDWKAEAKSLGETIDELLKSNREQHSRLVQAVFGFEEDATFADTLMAIKETHARGAELHDKLATALGVDRDHGWDTLIDIASKQAKTIEALNGENASMNQKLKTLASMRFTGTPVFGRGWLLI